MFRLSPYWSCNSLRKASNSYIVNTIKAKLDPAIAAVNGVSCCRTGDVGESKSIPRDPALCIKACRIGCTKCLFIPVRTLTDLLRISSVSDPRVFWVF